MTTSATHDETFSRMLRRSAARHPFLALGTMQCRTPQGTHCELCLSSRLPYEAEYAMKQEALQAFWSTRHLPGTLAPLVPSPQPRHYRTVSKRKVFFHKPKYTLGLLGLDEARSNTFGLEVGQCMIEPRAHSEVYQAVASYLGRSEQRELAELLTYVIVKGSDKEFAVILNAASYAPHERQMFTAFSKYITKRVPAVAAVFVFVDPERSKYYLSGNVLQAQKKRQMVLHKLFGASALAHTVGGKKFLYSPLSFSQTNHSILELFTERAGGMLGLSTRDHLYDLYCGYGLFSLCLAARAGSATGVELSRDSIEDAKANAVRQHEAHSRFIASDITEETLGRFLKHHGGQLKVLLDPPRNGTKPGVIETLAGYEPGRVCHIFCNIELIPEEMARWTAAGYRLTQAVPFDMFPGTDEVEIMVGLEPAVAKD